MRKVYCDICEKCATIIHCCTSMMKEGWEPDFQELAAKGAGKGAGQPALLPGA